MNRFTAGILFSLCLFHSQVLLSQDTSTLTERSNNTAACGSATSTCRYGFPHPTLLSQCGPNGCGNNTDNATNYTNPALTSPMQVAPPPPAPIPSIYGRGYLSKLSIHSLLYPGHTTKVFVHFMPWFNISRPDQHIDVGYDSINTAQI